MGVDSSDAAVCVHLVGGVWGLLAPGLLGAPSGYGKTYAGILIICTVISTSSLSFSYLNSARFLFCYFSD